MLVVVERLTGSRGVRDTRDGKTFGRGSSSSTPLPHHCGLSEGHLQTIIQRRLHCRVWLLLLALETYLTARYSTTKVPK